jgi:hypothetical protein
VHARGAGAGPAYTSQVVDTWCDGSSVRTRRYPVRVEREKTTPSDQPDAIAPETISGVCGWCGHDTWFRRRAAAWAGWYSYQSGPEIAYRPRLTGIYQCGGCENASLLVWTTFYSSGRGWIPTLEYTWPEAQATRMNDLVEVVQGDRLEAWNCFLKGQHRAAVLMARATLQRAVRFLLAGEDGVLNPDDRGTLFSELDLLVERRVITPQLRQNVDEVRLSGNDVAHPEEMGEVTSKDAEDSLTFLEDFLTTTLAVPARQRKRSERRESESELP